MASSERHRQHTNEFPTRYKNRMDSFPVPPPEVYGPPSGEESFFGNGTETTRDSEHSAPED